MCKKSDYLLESITASITELFSNEPLSSKSNQGPLPKILDVTSFCRTMIEGRSIELVSKANTNNTIIKTKKFCKPGIETNSPADNPAHVVAVVSKIVCPVFETDLTIPAGVSPSSLIRSTIWIESSTPIPKTIVPIMAVKTFTPTPPNLISNGCQRTTAPTAAIVNIANLGDLTRNAMAINRINIVQIVVRLCAL